MVETPSYAVAALLLPPTGCLLLALFALFALRAWPRLRTALIVISVGTVLVLSFPVVAFALLRLIEPPPLDDTVQPAAQAIVILGGGRNRFAPEWGGVTVNSATLQRARYGARLARKLSLPVLVSGGRPDGAGVSEGELMQQVLRDEFGVAVRWSEDASRNTRDNALFTRRILQPLKVQRIVLVTEGWHFARARHEFERNGFTVIAAPTGLIGARPFTLYQLVPTVESLRYAHLALREMLAAVWYGFGESDAGRDS